MEYLREEYHNLQKEVARLNKELEVRIKVIEELMYKNAELKKYGSEMYIKYQEEIFETIFNEKLNRYKTKICN